MISINPLFFLVVWILLIKYSIVCCVHIIHGFGRGVLMSFLVSWQMKLKQWYGGPYQDSKRVEGEMALDWS